MLNGIDENGVKFVDGEITNVFNDEQDWHNYDVQERAIAFQMMKEQESGRADITFEGFDISTTRFWASQEVTWLVENVFATDQPIVFGAPSKATKTTQLIDLSVALATKSKWLGYFKVPERKRVLFITGESKLAPVARRMERALQARGMNFFTARNYLRIECVQFPKLIEQWHLQQLAATVVKHRIDVVIIDPLYRALGGLDMTQVAEVGEAIVNLNQMVHPATLIISHHTTKSAARDVGKLPTLENLTGSGICESAGAWWLLNRTEPYRANGIHELIANYGGRDEQSGIIVIRFDETNWHFDIQSLDDFKTEKAQERKAEKQNEQDAKLTADQDAVLKVLDGQAEAQTKSWIVDRVPSSRKRTYAAIASLLADNRITELQTQSKNGRAITGYVIAK